MIHATHGLFAGHTERDPEGNGTRLTIIDDRAFNFLAAALGIILMFVAANAAVLVNGRPNQR